MVQPLKQGLQHDKTVSGKAVCPDFWGVKIASMKHHKIKGNF